MEYKLITFFAVSAAFAYVSRQALRVPRSHGFYRFFAWESILVLFVLNVQTWFENPLSGHQLLSWILLVVSIFMFARGGHSLVALGKPDSRRKDDVPVYTVEKTTVLITTGAFKYIRHPIFGSLLFMAWGIFFKSPSWIGGLLAFTATTMVFVTSKVEERENERYFGPAYNDYKKRTKMFVPFVF